MKYIVFIFCCIISTACTRYQPSDGLIEIFGIRDGHQVVRGMGVCIARDTVLTSAHVVRDDTLKYEIRKGNYELGIMNYELMERDMGTDIAYLRMKNEQSLCTNHRRYIGKADIRVGQNISIPVIRSGSVMTLTGSITSLTGTILAYDTLGRTQLLSGVLITDMSLQPGDSGAPILDEEGRVVDVVHVQ